MARACLIHALHPDENERVILRVSYARPGILRVGVEAVWRAMGAASDGKDAGVEARGDNSELLSGWDRDMPAVSEGGQGGKAARTDRIWTPFLAAIDKQSGTVRE